MTREVSDIWKKEIRQAGPIPPRAGKQPCVVAQGSADFMGPLRPCGPRPADSKLISCSGHSWRQSQVEGCRREVRRHGNDKKMGEEGYREISEVLYKLPGPQVPTRDQVLQNDNKKKKKKERGEREGLQRRVYRSEKEKKIKDMNKNMTPIFLLSCSESSLPAM